MTATRPLDWIQEIEASIVELDEKPQFGLPSSFEWSQFQEEFRQLLDPQLKITHTVKGWMAANQVFTGLGGKLFTLAIEWLPLSSPSFFVTDQQNMKELMAKVFESEDVANYFYESSYVQGFYHYFAAEILRILDKQQFSAPLTPRLGADAEHIHEMIKEEACFVIDVALNVDGKNLWGRILLSESFRRDWKSYFAHLGPPPISEEMKQKVSVDIGLEVAHTHLSLEDWRKVKNGDFIVLDHCSYDPIEHKGAIILTLQQKPIFRGRLKDGGIKITNYPVYEEVTDAMEDKSFSNDFETDEDDDEDLYGDLEEDEDSDFDEDEEDIFAGLEPKKEPYKEKEEKRSSNAAQLAPTEEAISISPEELPVHLMVEVGRLRMTVGALMNLAPGNLLELNVSPEQGVDLVVNGKKVGRGELIRIGDVLGVRIISL